MKKTTIFSLICILMTLACLSANKVVKKSDTFSAVEKSVKSLDSDPENRNKALVLKENYEMALKWSQEELDRILTLNEPFKWETIAGLMEEVNKLNDIIGSSPSAMKVISSPKLFTAELKMAREKAAEEYYNAGVAELEKKTRESARLAFDNFNRANDLLPGNKDISNKIKEAKTKAYLNVVLEMIPVQSAKDQLSFDFFYNQILDYLKSKYSDKNLVSFLTPEQAKNIGLKQPDLVVKLEFSDLVVNMPIHNQEEKNEYSREQIVSDEQVPGILYDQGKVVTSRNPRPENYIIYQATIITMADKVTTNGVLNLKIFCKNDQNPVVSECFPGSYTWENKYYIVNGDAKVVYWGGRLLKYQQSGPKPIPSGQDFLIELTKPIYDKLTVRLDQFFRKYS